MSHIIQCRICGKKFDTEQLSKSEWVMPVPKYYYHRKCYEDWRENKYNPKADNKPEDYWYESLVDYLYRDVKMSVDFKKLKSQWNLFTSPGKKMTPKGIFFAIQYYYDVLHGDPAKAQGGIGIVSSIYKDAAAYWTDLEYKKAGTLEKIIAQMETRRERPVVKITSKKEEKDKKVRWSLEDI